jgi:enhancing lycopene biosynthesis protein 2
MAKVGVLLSGCGVYDGAEIHESVITILALDRHGAEAVFIAPEEDQMHVINHLAGEPVAGETRKIREEAARIARGEVKDIQGISAADLDALVVPGGFGAAKNLCDFAVKGKDCSVHSEVKRLVLDMHAAGKPIAALCIAPALIAKIFEGTGVSPTLTIGKDKETADTITAMGSVHKECEVRNFVIDRDNKIVTTPAYMLAENISEAADGIQGAIKEVLALI